MKTSYSFPPFQRRSSHSALVVLFSFVAAVVVLAMAGGIVKADPGALSGAGGDPPPVVVDSIEPAEIVQGQVPQPTLKIFGSNFIEGLPSETNRPTVTLRQPGKGGAEFSALAWVNFSATVATLPADLINLLQAPLGVYDVIVTRPTDNASGTLEGAFTVTDGDPGPGEIGLVVRSAWGGPVFDVDVAGDLAYAAIGRRLVILDIADPTNPVEIGSLYIASGVSGVRVSGDYVFLSAARPYRFTAVDVSDPANPTMVWAGQGDSFPIDVLLYSTLAYTRGSTGDVDVFDISDPPSTVHLGQNQSISALTVMTIADDRLYVGTSSWDANGGDTAELRIYDLSGDPLNPVLLGSVASGDGWSSTGLAVEGDYAAWTVRNNDNDNTHTLHIVDVSNAAAPTVLWAQNDFDGVGGHKFADVDLVGGYAYVAEAAFAPRFWSTTRGLVVYDVASDPTNLTIVSTFKTHGDVWGVRVVGDRAYLFDQGEGLIILDVSDPAKPVRLGNYHSPSTLREITKVGDLLYVTDAWNGFTVLDVSNETHPEVVSVYLAEHYNDLGVDARGIDVRDNLVYLGAGYLGLEVVDVSEPVSPALVGAFRIPLPAVPQCGAHFAAVKVWGDDPRYASIGFDERTCEWVNGVFLNVDVTNPQDMFEVGRRPHGQPRARKIAINEQGFAFLARPSAVALTINTSNPELPYWVRDGIESVADTALAGDTRLYLASDELTLEGVSGLYIQDVTDPANPVVLAHVDENTLLPDGVELSQAYAVATQNQRLYVVGSGYVPGLTYGATTYVFDASDPTAPELLAVAPFVGGINFGSSATSVLVDDPYQYVANATPNAGNAIGKSGLIILELLGINPADLDGDGSVGVTDLLILLGSWGPCADCNLPGDCPADLNDDCSVGVKDLLILLGNWG